MTDERRVSLPRLDPSSIRRSYDSVASRYADEFVEELAYKPLDRALLTVLAADVRRAGHGPIAFHTGEEVRHLDEWWDHEVDLDFRFPDARQVTDHLDHAGFTTEAVLVRASYLEETDTRRTYVLARRNAA